MQLEEYFDFLAPNDIRIKGHRIGIESVLYEYVHRSQTPAQIAAHFPTLSLEQIHAAILYYLHNKSQIDTYLAEWIEHEDRMVAEQDKCPTAAILRLRQIKAKRRAAKHRAREYQPA